MGGWEVPDTIQGAHNPICEELVTAVFTFVGPEVRLWKQLSPPFLSAPNLPFPPQRLVSIVHILTLGNKSSCRNFPCSFEIKMFYLVLSRNWQPFLFNANFREVVFIRREKKKKGKVTWTLGKWKILKIFINISKHLSHLSR